MSYIKAIPTVLSKTANYTVSTNDGDNVQVNVSASGGAVTIALYAASGNAGKIITVKKTDSSANAVTLDGDGSETLDGALTLSLPKQYDSATLVCNGTNWTSVSVAGQTYNGQTISSAATFTGTLTAADNVGLAATKKLYLDGVAMSGDTYISESSANVLSLFSGGVEAKLTSGLLTVSGAGFNYFSAGTNAQQAVVVTNTTNGTAATALLRVQTTAGTANYGTLQAYSSGYTTGTVDIASSVLLQSEGSGGLSLAATNGSGVIRFYSGGSTEQLRIGTGGDVGMKTGARLYLDGVTGGDTYITETASNVMRLYAGGSDVLILTNAGLSIGVISTTATAANMVYDTGDGYVKRSTSSIRYKHDVATLDGSDALAAVMAMRPITYRGKTDADQRRYVGFLAEEIQQWAPLLCTYDEGGESGTPNYVTYDRVTAYLVAVVQQHDATINQLAARIAALEAAQESK